MSMVALLFGACKNATDKAKENAEQALNSAESMMEEAVDYTKKAIEVTTFAGSYQGVIPCASCEGIQLELKLNVDQTYELTESYLGEKDPLTKTFTGKFSLDKDVIKLDGLKDMSNLFKVEMGQVRYLNTDGTEVTGNLAENYVLMKK